MKSIICYFSSSYNGINFIYVILAFTIHLIRTATSTPPCGLYGAPPCRFLPAPPGQTPSCARPGKTYCEHIDNYPVYLIKHLVHKWGYEAKNLLVDETWDDFATVAWPDTPVFYDPAYIFPQRHNHGKDFNGYSYDTPPYGSRTGNGNGNGNANSNYNDDPYQYSKSSTTEGPTFLLYTSSAGTRLNIKNPASAYASSTAKSTPNTPTLWLKRIVRDLSKKSLSKQGGKPPLIIDTSEEEEEKEDKLPAKSTSARDVSINMDLWDIMGIEKGPNSRFKRQSSLREELCQTTSQFITPQAALNSKGNWMFVVNEENTARQTVKAVLCASNTCSNLCSLPNGYNSRCEQKFVQKRLIALQANGQNLYTDTFWFPSCCVCTIASDKATSSDRVKHVPKTHASSKKTPYFRDKLREQDRIQRLYGEKKKDTGNFRRRDKERLSDKQRYSKETTRKQNRMESTSRQSHMESTRRQNRKQENPAPRIVYVHVPVHVPVQVPVQAFMPNPFMRFPVPIFPPLRLPNSPVNPYMSRPMNPYNFPNYCGSFYRN